ncbi:Uncharacterised protein [Mesomycoplasma dispar]|uniref:Adhesin n=1 Tax=Mesomycoplasma dispar TaxID=86660 RepID=A0AAJ5NMI6_9BACT|nr:hypothetical protein [Mesomycoplasma dispar]AJR12493.1 adhesin [Mesomycoplasma dispar]VEU62750.1 Uncharacterised protein [Mesomycoplasma dispar]
MAKNKNTFIGAATAIVGVAVFATTIGLVTRIRYTGENPRAELENLVSRVKNVAFKSDVFDNSTTYKQIKATLFDENGKLLPNIDLNKFISFYTTYNSKIRRFDVTFTPNKPFFEFVNLIPNDEDQSFELQFRAKHQLDNNYTAYSTILSKKITFAQRSQFALADFNANLEKITESFKENIQNLRKKDLTRNFASENSLIISQKIPSLTRVEDFASDINKSGTQEEAIERISQYFPDFQKIIYELNDDKNNSLPFRKGKIFNFSLERHSGTNDFIALDSNSVPSFLVKAELTNDAKFELKGLNIQEVQMLEKVNLVPASESGKNKEKEVETPKTGEQTEGESSTSTTTEGEKTKKTDSKSPSVSTKSPTYFADIEEILNKISLRKLEFKDFKVTSKSVDDSSSAAATAPAAAAASTLGSQTEIPTLIQVSSTNFQQQQPQQQQEESQTQEQQQQESQAQEQQSQPSQTEETSKKEDLTKYLEVSTQKVNDFLAGFNKKIYRSLKEKSKAFVDKINSDLLIKPISLDFGEFSPYFKDRQTDGVDYFLDVANAKTKDGSDGKEILEIPVTINLYSGFFGDSNNKILKSKKTTFEVPFFKKADASTQNGQADDNLDKTRKEFYTVDSLPTKSSEPVTVAVNAATTSSPQTSQPKKITVSSSTGYISKAELEALIGGTSSETDGKTTKESNAEEIKKVIGNPFQYAYNFDANEGMLKAWVGKQNFPTLKDFADFKENNSIASEYKVKSLKSDKFFVNDFDVAAFYAHLAQMDPAQVLEYLLEIAKALNLVDKSTKLSAKDIRDGNVFNSAAGIKLNVTEENPVYALGFNNQFLGFDNRGWISNLFLPKEVAKKFTQNQDDDAIFEELNKYSSVELQTGAGGSGSAVGGKGGSGTSDSSLYGDLQKKASEIKEKLKTTNSSILKATTNENGSGSAGSAVGGKGGSGVASSDPTSIETEIKKFFTDKTQEFRNLKDVLLAFYFKAKELNNFSAWSKLGDDLDYKIVFEKQNDSTGSSGSDSTTEHIPNGLEAYKLTYHYEVFDVKTKDVKYKTPKIELSLWLNKNASNSKEKEELNKAVLTIPPSFSLVYLGQDDFDKINKKDSSDSETSHHFDKTEHFKKIQAKVQEHNKDLKVSVISEDEDRFNPKRYKIVNLQVEKTGTQESQPSNKSVLYFQVRVVLDETIKNSSATSSVTTSPSN